MVKQLITSPLITKAIRTKNAKNYNQFIMNSKFLTKSTYFTPESLFRPVVIVKNSLLLAILKQKRQKQYLSIKNTYKY